MGLAPNPFAKSGAPLAGGLALVEPDPGTLIAFNAAPGTVAQNEGGSLFILRPGACGDDGGEGGPSGDGPVSTGFVFGVNEITKGARKVAMERFKAAGAVLLL